MELISDILFQICHSHDLLGACIFHSDTQAILLFWDTGVTFILQMDIFNRYQHLALLYPSLPSLLVYCWASAVFTPFPFLCLLAYHYHLSFSMCTFLYTYVSRFLCRVPSQFPAVVSNNPHTFLLPRPAAPAPALASGSAASAGAPNWRPQSYYRSHLMRRPVPDWWRNGAGMVSGWCRNIAGMVRDGVRPVLRRYEVLTICLNSETKGEGRWWQGT